MPDVKIHGCIATVPKVGTTRLRFKVQLRRRSRDEYAASLERSSQSTNQDTPCCRHLEFNEPMRSNAATRVYCQRRCSSVAIGFIHCSRCNFRERQMNKCLGQATTMTRKCAYANSAHKRHEHTSFISPGPLCAVLFSLIFFFVL